MNSRKPLGHVKIESILHPSDFSEASEIAFVHALKIALVTKARLNMMHVTNDSRIEWQDFPGVRETLERWRLLHEDSLSSSLDMSDILAVKVKSPD